MSSENHTELAAQLYELDKINKGIRTDLEEFSSPRVIFAQPHELDPTKFANGKANPTGKTLDSGSTSPLFTKISLPHSPPVYISESPYTPPPCLQVGASGAARLASEGVLPGFIPTASNNDLFGFCQDWVHQNPVIQLDGGIDEDGKWQSRWKNLVFSFAQCYDVPPVRVGKWFVLDLEVYLNGIQGRNWNVECVLVFQTFIMKYVQLVTCAKNICV